VWYGEPKAIRNAVSYAKFFSRSHHTVIRVYDEAGNVVPSTLGATTQGNKYKSKLDRMAGFFAKTL
jgi:hypothetical protein